MENKEKRHFWLVLLTRKGETATIEIFTRNKLFCKEAMKMALEDYQGWFISSVSYLGFGTLKEFRGE